jgi:hypothetical protein
MKMDVWSRTACSGFGVFLLQEGSQPPPTKKKIIF